MVTWLCHVRLCLVNGSAPWIFWGFRGPYPIYETEPSPFPDAQILLERVGEESGGNVYRWAEKGMEGWLCPALLLYFKKPPEKLYIQVKAAG